MDQEAAQNPVDALYDFLYLDRERIAAYTAQFDDLGVLTETKKTGAHSTSGTTTGTIGVPQVASGALTGTDGTTNTIDRRYDTRYTVPLNLIDSLDESGMIERDLSKARIGGVVLLQGTLTLLDVRALKEIWKPLLDLMLDQQIPSATLNTKLSTKGLQGARLVEMRNLQATQENLRNARQQMEAQFKTLAELIKVFPHPLQAEIQGEHGLAWAALNPAQMVIDIDGVTLMHGSAIAGEWSCIALVDAIPEPVQPNPNPFESLGPSPSVREAMRSFQQMIRLNFGRPHFAYGISPVAIYRSVERPQSPTDVDES